MTQELPVLPPKFGLNDSKAKAEQPPGTTSHSLNMRTSQASTGRLRVSSRNGHVPFLSAEVGRNRIAFSEDMSHYRDTREGDIPWPVSEGWRVGIAGAKSFSAATDGTLAPDGLTQAYLCTQLLAGSDRVELVQELDVLEATSRNAARAGSTWIRTPGTIIMLSLFVKASTATQTLLSLRQGSLGTMARNTLTISWSGGVPTVVQASVPTGNVYGYSDEGNGWYRFWMAITWNESDEANDANAGSILRVILRPNQGSTGVAGTYFWGAQLELRPTGSTRPTRYEPALGRNDPTKGQRATALTAVSHLVRNVDYTRKGAQLTATSTSTPDKQPARGLAYDQQQNRYVLEAQAVVKYTPEGTLVYSIPVPVKDPAHVCEAIHVDEVGQIYVGVTSGGNATQAVLVCFRQGPKEEGGVVREDSWHLLWTLEPQRFVTNISSRNGVLYTLQDDPQRERSYVVTYSALDLSAPELDASWKIPYPSAGMGIKTDGSVVTCHPTNPVRGLDPSAGASDLNGPWPTAIGWVPMRDLANWQQDCWAYLDSESLDGDALTVDRYEQEAEVTEWVDLTGKQRNLYKPTGVAAPFVDLQAINGIPGVRFRGAQGLQSNPNPGTDPSAKDLMRTLFPSYDGAEFTAFVVFRPTFSSSQGAVIGQALINDTSPAQDAYYVLGANRGASNTISNAVRGVVSLFDHADGTADPAPAGTGNHPDDAMVESGDLANFCVATLQCGTGTNESQVRINGALGNRNAVGVRYASKAVAGTGATSLGYFSESASFGSFDGVILAVMVYTRLLTDTEIELHEGYFANRYGGQGRLAAGHPYRITPAARASPASAAPDRSGTGVSPVNTLNARQTLLAKFAPGGELKWALANYSGVGYDLALDSNGDIYSFGEYAANESLDYVQADRGQNGWLRKIVDAGTSATVSTTVADWWQNLCRNGTASASNDFSVAFWTLTNIVLGAAVTDPFGNTQGTTVSASANGASVRSDIAAASLIDGSLYTFSMYMKAGSATTSRLRIQAGTASTVVDIVHSTGAITPTFTGTGRTHRFNSEDVGNGWRRLQVTINWLTADSTIRIEFLPTTAAAGFPLSVLAYGAMLERNSRASTFAYGPTQAKHHSPPSSLLTTRPRIAIDKFNNVFVPGPFPTPTTTVTTRTVFSMRVYDSSLYLVHDLDLGTIAGSTLVPGRAVLVNADVPEYATQNPGLVRNLLGYTERFVDATNQVVDSGTSSPYWTRDNVSATPAARIAPNGTLTADTLDDISGSASGRIYADADPDELVDGQAYTFSVYLAPQDAGRTTVALEHVAGGAAISLDITWDAVMGRAPTVVASGSSTSFSVTPSENGYFRFAATLPYTGAQGPLRCVIAPDANPATQGAVSAWGAQLELGSAATPYQPAQGLRAFIPAAAEDTVLITNKATLVTSSADVVAGTARAATLHEIELVSSRPNGLPARAHRLCAVRRGSFFVFDRTMPPQIPMGGSGVLDTTARYVSSASIYQSVIASDGRTSVIYQPGVDGRVRPYKATRGSVPEGVQLWANYLGRAWCARTKDDPHFWAASALENVFDWDFFSPPLRSDMAVFATTSRAGRAPDMINALIPYRDQMLVIGCDSSVWYLAGDPMSSNAQWQLASEETGIAFGDKSHCISEDGTLYFFGSRGGLWAFTASGPRPITTETIDRRLANVNLQTHFVELQWNWRAQGIHIFVIPYANPTQVSRHFFYGLRHQDWREDSFGSVNVEPVSSCIIDGDEPQDRSLLLISGASRVLQWDESVDLDDGEPFVAEELIGPYANGDNDVLWMELSAVMGEDTTGARFDLYSSSSANDPGASKANGTLVAGRNPRKMHRVRGAKFWMQLSTLPGTRLSFEEAVIRAADQGKAKLL